MSLQQQSFGDFSSTSIIGVNSSTWVMIVVVALGLLLARTTIGHYMYASGGNAEAARIAGVRVYLTRIIAFALSGGAAAIGGIIARAQRGRYQQQRAHLHRVGGHRGGRDQHPRS